jgi:Xaa-Pro aminopeptidase
MHEFLRNRSKGFAYTPIIASGENANVLHYIANNMQCKDGDVILLDVGAEYANYSSDLTRMIPVNGKFTARTTRSRWAATTISTESFIRLSSAAQARTAFSSANTSAANAHRAGVPMAATFVDRAASNN